MTAMSPRERKLLRRFLLQRQVLNSINALLGISGLGDQFQISDALADCHSNLRGVDYADERAAATLTFCRFSKKIEVARKKNAPQESGSVK